MSTHIWELEKRRVHTPWVTWGTTQLVAHAVEMFGKPELVAEVLPNGNLVVQGEKWLGINQGNEFVRMRGIIRPVDITADNTVQSTQVANAQLYYGGTGALRDSNTPGWLTRFFSSPIWPI